MSTSLTCLAKRACYYSLGISGDIWKSGYLETSGEHRGMMANIYWVILRYLDVCKYLESTEECCLLFTGVIWFSIYVARRCSIPDMINLKIMLNLPIKLTALNSDNLILILSAATKK